MSHLKTLMGVLGSSVVVTVSGETAITGFAFSPANSQAGVRANNGGTIDKREDAIYTQVDAPTDWIIPNSAAPGDYEIRCTNKGDALHASSDSTGVWLALTTTREWYVERSGEGTNALDLTLEIRKGSSGGALDSGDYIGGATVGSV